MGDNGHVCSLKRRNPKWNSFLCPRLGWLKSPSLSLILVNCSAGTAQFSGNYARLQELL